MYPITCIGCSQVNSNLCFDCLGKIQKASDSPEDFIYSIFSYKDPLIKKAIWKFKFEGKQSFVEPLSSILYDYILEILGEAEVMYNFTNPILLSIPSSEQHKKKRPYDQGKILCGALERLDNKISFVYKKNILSRMSSSKPQTDITNRSKRIKNIKGAFSISVNNKKYIQNKNIILIDDVTTTGATLKEARKVLKQAGAKRVIAFTVTH